MKVGLTKWCFTFAIGFCLFGSSGLYAETLNLGVISFDSLIPGAPGLPGINGFTFSNFTGDPATGGFALPPDFPSLTGVSFTSGSVSLNAGGPPLVFALGDIGIGSFNPIDLQFPDTVNFSAAVFSAGLDQTTFLLADGNIFVATSPALSVTFLPSSGSALVPGVDLALITVSGTLQAPGAVPEPATLLQVLLLAPFIVIKVLKKTRPVR